MFYQDLSDFDPSYTRYNEITSQGNRDALFRLKIGQRLEEGNPDINFLCKYKPVNRLSNLRIYAVFSRK